MTPSGRGRSPGFTLIELMISVGLVMAMAAIAMSAFLQIRRVVARSEARMALYASAQHLYTFLNRTFGCVQPNCAILTTLTRASASAASDPSSIRLIYMRAKEQSEEFGSNSYPNTDLLWEQLVWTRSDRTLRKGTSSQGWKFTSASFSPAGVNYNGKSFTSVPQPRRRLDPANPTGVAPGGLNDNMYFPSSLTDPAPPAAPASLANANGQDFGDYTNLQNNLLPIFEKISALSVQIESNDGTLLDLDPDNSGTATQNDVFQGLWLDGRLVSPLTAPQVYAASDLAKRPRLMRWRFTLSEPLPSEPGGALNCVFSFSFVLPGLLGDR